MTKEEKGIFLFNKNNIHLVKIKIFSERYKKIHAFLECNN
jgi:hypothetical protein